MELPFEYMLAQHCAPALAGIKPADLVSCPQSPELLPQIEAYNASLNPQGIRFRLICRCRRRALLLVYRQAKLEQHLALPEIRACLRAAGYPAEQGLEELLGQLEGRLAEQVEFPHEIGLFLGYPVQDVQGFCRNKGQNYKLAGRWKVYSDVEEARRRFSRYDRCCAALYEKVERGISITRLFRTA